MWDPISLFFCMWVLNAGLPEARLKVSDVIQAKENKIIIDSMRDSVKLREGS